MEVPILKQGNYLIASIQSALSDTDLALLRDSLVERVGMQPEVAFTMVQLGLSLPDISTALDLEEGLIHLDQKTGAGEDPSSKRRGLSGER